MLKLIASLAFLVVASAVPGFIAQTNSIVQPAPYIGTDTSSAITHQSNVNLVRKVPLSPVVPVAQAVPLSVSVAGVKNVLPAVVQSAPIISTYAAPAPPVFHTTVPLVHSVPIVKTVVAAAPIDYNTLHK